MRCHPWLTYLILTTKYSLQTSIYNLMLQQTHGIDVGKRMYILRMHTDRKGKYPGKPEYELVQCRDLRSEACELLRLEEERLAAKPPPPPPAAAPAAPMDTGKPPQPQSAAVAPKRPRGAAPAGKVWQDGKWVEHQTARKAPTPVSVVALKTRPAHGARKGMAWDGVAGCWMACRKGFQKRKAPVAPPSDENAVPQARKVRRRA